MKKSAESRLEEHSRELFSECSADDQCDEYSDPVLLDVTVPDDGTYCRGDRDAAPEQMNQKGKIPEAKVDPELTRLVTVEEKIDEGQDDWIGENEQCDESVLRRPLNCVP